MNNTAALLSLLCVAACDDQHLDTSASQLPEDTTPAADTDTGSDALSYEGDVLPILEEEIWEGWTGKKESCVSCHENTYTSLRFSDGYAVLMAGELSIADVPWVTPGDRSSSYLYLKLIDDYGSVGGEGLVMPPNESDEMSGDDIETIGLWIDQGARP